MLRPSCFFIRFSTVFQNVRAALYNFRKILSFFEGAYRPIIVVFSVTGLYTLFEGIGIASLIPLFYKMSDRQSGSGGRFSEIVDRLFEYLPFPLTPENLLIFILVLFLLKALLHFLSRYLQSRFLLAYVRDLRSRLVRGLFRTNWEFFMSRKKGELMNDVISLPTSVRNMLRTLFNTLVNVSSSLVYLAVALTISPLVTALALGVVAVAAAALLPLARWSREEGKRKVEARQKLSDYIQQFLSVFKELRSSVSYQRAIDQSEQQIEASYRAQLSARTIYHTSVVGITLFAELSAIAFLFISYSSFQIGIAEAGVLVVLLWRIINRANNIRDFQKVAETMPALDVIRERLEQFRTHETSFPSVQDRYNFRNQIEFEKVSYRYPVERSNDEEVSVKHLSFQIPKGAMIGLAGESGSGKSTIINLLLGLAKPQTGIIRVDGTPLEELNLAEWRNAIGYVPQSVTLLNDTIQNNIRFYRDLSDEQIQNAARQAQAHEFITEKKKGYQTIVGEEGVRLSGGEKQRIALASALAGDPQILILDEATSELDSISEEKIKQVIDRMKGERTVIAIAHRISTILDADRILVLDGGEITERGTRDELLERNEAFAELYNRQMEER